MTEKVTPCIGCAHLTPASVTGDGFRCVHPRAFTTDYVTGALFAPRAQWMRAVGDCGPGAVLREQAPGSA